MRLILCATQSRSLGVRSELAPDDGGAGPTISPGRTEVSGVHAKCRAAGGRLVGARRRRPLKAMVRRVAWPLRPRKVRHESQG